MPFHIYISDSEQAYLDNLPVSPEVKERINRFVEEGIANFSDKYRLDPMNRPSPDSPYFKTQFLIRDIWGDNEFHIIEFHIRDDTAEYGVLTIVFIDHH